MNNVLAAKVLMSHLPEITDGAYKTATEIAIETLCEDALSDLSILDVDITPKEYFGLSEEEFGRWVLGNRS